MSDLKKRTKAFALQAMDAVELLPRTTKGRVIAQQLLRAATSVGANYRAACRARSQAEFVAKLGVVIEEADESAYWMELAVEGGLLEADAAEATWREADELVAIMTASRKTAERGTARKPPAGIRHSALGTRH